MRDRRISVVYPFGGEIYMLFWEHHYNKKHLMVARTPEQLDAMASRNLLEKARQIVYEPPFRAELVAPSRAMRESHEAAVRRMSLGTFEDVLVDNAQTIFEATGQMPHGVKRCEECACGRECGAENHNYLGYYIDGLDIEAMYDRNHEAISAYDPDNPVTPSRAREALEGETVFEVLVMTKQGMREVDADEYHAINRPLFFITNPKPIELPRLDAMRVEWEAKIERELQARRAEREAVEAQRPQRNDKELKKAREMLAKMMRGFV